MIGAAAQVRTDPQTGTREEAGFIGHGRSMFSVTYVPRAEPVAGIVVCPPFLGELNRNYRREVLVARALAASGVAVQRFHYRGCGHSPPASPPTADSMVEDALEARDHLAGRTGIASGGFLGTRLGALTAAAAWARGPGSPLILWEPAVDGDRYFRDLLRQLSISGLGTGSQGRDPGSLMNDLRANGRLEVFGHVLERSQLESFAGRRLEPSVGGPDRPVLIVSFGRPGARQDASAQRWRELGSPVEVIGSDVEESWWFPPPARTERADHDRAVALAERTSAALAELMPRGDSS